MFDPRLSYQGQRWLITRSILNPLLVLDTIIWVPGLPALYWVPEWVQPWILGMLVASAGLTALAYIYFAVRDPDRLQSEQHREVMRSYDLMGDDRQIPPSVIHQLPPVANKPLGEVPDESDNSPRVGGAGD